MPVIKSIKHFIAPMLMFGLTIVVMMLIFGPTITSYVMWGLMTGVFLTVAGVDRADKIMATTGMVVTLTAASVGLSHTLGIAFAATIMGGSVTDWSLLCIPFGAALFIGFFGGMHTKDIMNSFQVASIPLLALVAIMILIVGVEDFVQIVQKMPVIGIVMAPISADTFGGALLITLTGWIYLATAAGGLLLMCAFLGKILFGEGVHSFR